MNSLAPPSIELWHLVQLTPTKVNKCIFSFKREKPALSSLTNVSVSFQIDSRGKQSNAMMITTTYCTKVSQR